MGMFYPISALDGSLQAANGRLDSMRQASGSAQMAVSSWSRLMRWMKSDEWKVWGRYARQGDRDEALRVMSRKAAQSPFNRIYEFRAGPDPVEKESTSR